MEVLATQVAVGRPAGLMTEVHALLPGKVLRARPYITQIIVASMQRLWMDYVALRRRLINIHVYMYVIHYATTRSHLVSSHPRWPGQRCSPLEVTLRSSPSR